MDIKEQVEKVLMQYMDGTWKGFEGGYIPDLFNVIPLRDDIIKLIDNIIHPKCTCSKCTGILSFENILEQYEKDNI